MTGKAMRLKRVIDPEGVSVICALDHGMTSPTFLEPLANITTRAAETIAGGANVIMMSKGMIRIAEPAFSPTTSLALLLSASASPDGDRPEIVQIAEETVRERGAIKSQIEALYRQQLKSKLDLDLVQVELTNAESLLIRARNDLKASFADRPPLRLLELPVNPPFEEQRMADRRASSDR